MPGYLAYLQRCRRPLAAVLWATLAVSIWGGWLRFDPRTLTLSCFGLELPVRLFYILFLLGLATFGALVWWTVRHGRMVCSCLCPYHQLLEWIGVPRSISRLAIAVAAVVFSGWCMAHFVGAPGADFASTPSAVLWVTGSAVVGVLVLLVGAREKVCQQVCPYGIAQILMRTDTTLRVTFRAARCINWQRCNGVCPMRLEVRRDCDTHLCTNCSRCIGECMAALDVDWQQAALELHAPEPSNAAPGHR